MHSARLLAWSFALLLIPGAAFAQPDVARRDAEARFKEGLARVQSGDFEAARLAFVQAYSVLKSSDVLWNLALSELKSNHPLEALAHFNDYVKDARTSEPDRAKARKYIDELHTRVGRVTVDAPAGATLLVDGRPLAEMAPLAEPIDVAPGEHFVEARLGDRSRNLRVEAPAGGVVAVHFRADEFANGASTAPAAASAASSTPSSAEKPVEPPAESPRSETTRYVVSGVLVGAGIVAAGGAVAFALSATSSKKDGDAIMSGAPSNACVGVTSSDCAALDDARRSEIRKDNWAVGLGVTSAALVVGGVATFFMWPHQGGGSSAGNVRVAPLVGGATGASVLGSF